MHPDSRTAIGPTLETARLVLKPFCRADATGLLCLFRDRGVRRYLLDDLTVSREWILDEIDASELRFGRAGSGLWSVRPQQSETIIGFGGFREFFDPPQLQLLYGLLPAYWGQGLATEIGRLLCQHGFSALGFSHIHAATDAPNKSSIRVLERLGMQRVDPIIHDDGSTLFFSLQKNSQ